MRIKTAFAALFVTTSLSSHCYGQEVERDIYRFADAKNKLGLVGFGSELSNAAIDKNLGEAAGVIVSEVAPNILPFGILGREVFDLIAGDAIADLTASVVNLAVNRPDRRSCVEKAMDQSGISYEDILTPNTSGRGQRGQLEYEVDLRDDIAKRLADEAASTNQSYTQGCLEFERRGFQQKLAKLDRAEQEDQATQKVSSCVVSETDLYKHFLEVSGGGAAFANNSTIRISELQTTEVISENPYVYRLHDVELCSELKKSGPVAGNTGISDTLYDSIKAEMISELAGYCQAGSTISGDDKAFTITGNGNLKVELGRLQCQWEFINHPFCGARACEVREYLVEGSDSRLLRSYLE